MGQPLLALLKALPHERILDLGCGHGTLTQHIAPLCDHVVAVDASENMVKHAQSTGLDARVINGESLNFNSEFDAIFSNAALHWMLKPGAVLNGCFRALKPNGRIVAEMGGSGNVKHIVEALNNQRVLLDFEPVMPWFFPDVEEYSELARNAGFKIRSIQLFERPTPLPTGIKQWLTTFAHHFVSDLTTAQSDHLISQTCKNLEDKLMDSGGGWFADYVRLRFELYKS